MCVQNETTKIYPIEMTFSRESIFLIDTKNIRVEYDVYFLARLVFVQLEFAKVGCLIGNFDSGETFLTSATTFQLNVLDEECYNADFDAILEAANSADPEESGAIPDIDEGNPYIVLKREPLTITSLTKGKIIEYPSTCLSPAVTTPNSKIECYGYRPECTLPCGMNVECDPKLEKEYCGEYAKCVVNPMSKIPMDENYYPPFVCESFMKGSSAHSISMVVAMLAMLAAVIALY